MIAAKSAKSQNKKPAKPHPDFPLFAHQRGYWCKKVKGKLVYFRRWNDPQGSLEDWLDQKDDLLAGRTPRAKRAGELTVRDGINLFLSAYEKQCEADGLSRGNFTEKYKALKLFANELGDRYFTDLRSDDFTELKIRLKDGRGCAVLRRDIKHVKHCCAWLYEEDHLERPIKYGRSFRPPSQDEELAERNERGLRFIPREVLLEILTRLSPHLRAFCLLAINTGLNPVDIATLKKSRIDLKEATLSINRKKSKKPINASLWPETISAVKAAIASQPKTKHTTLFVTDKRRNWTAAKIGKDWRAELEAMDMWEPLRAFAILRNTYRTVAGSAKDKTAINATMGHAAKSIGEVRYEAFLFDEKQRLEAVAETVRQWLFGDDLYRTEERVERSESVQ